MKMRTILVNLILVIPSFAIGQVNLSLDQCQQLAQENYPLIRQYSLIDKSQEYNLSNISKTYLPQISFNAQASYQTAVPTIPIDFKALNLPIDIKSPNKDQYKTTLDISQLIWDGGNTKAKKSIAKANAEIEKKQVDVTLYQIKQRINQLYFGILAIDKQLNLLDLLAEDLESNREVMLSMFKNQIITQSELDQIDVQILNVEQNKTEQRSNKLAYLKMLSLFINEPINENSLLAIPIAENIKIKKIDRPELELYKAKFNYYDLQKNLIKAKNMPHLGLFAQGGYGNPGLNMLKNKFDFYAIGGVKLSWNISNLYTKNNEDQDIKLKQESIKVEEDTFLFNTKFETTKTYEDILKIKELLSKDDEIITLRERIKKASESKYKNGVATANDLLEDINASNKAKQTKALREIEYLQYIYNYKYLQGE